MSHRDARRLVRQRHDAVAEDLAHLLWLVETTPGLEPGRRTARLPPARPSDADSRRAAEQRLRAVGELLAALHTTLEGRSGARPAGARAQPGTAREAQPHAAVNGAGGPGTDLAGAAARYIARDLAARRLSAFTSAEGYRLARALAAVGRVEAEVEQLLAEANTVTLHPGPLGDTVSHSAV